MSVSSESCGPPLDETRLRRLSEQLAMVAVEQEQQEQVTRSPAASVFSFDGALGYGHADGGGGGGGAATTPVGSFGSSSGYWHSASSFANWPSFYLPATRCTTPISCTGSGGWSSVSPVAVPHSHSSAGYSSYAGSESDLALAELLAPLSLDDAALYEGQPLAKLDRGSTNQIQEDKCASAAKKRPPNLTLKPPYKPSLEPIAGSEPATPRLIAEQQHNKETALGDGAQADSVRQREEQEMAQLEHEIMGGKLKKQRSPPPPHYVCHRCHVPGHYIRYCPYPQRDVAWARAQQQQQQQHGRQWVGVTPYEGYNRCFGEFACVKCKRVWRSVNSFANSGQRCVKCHIVAYPRKQLSLRRALTNGLMDESQRVSRRYGRSLSEPAASSYSQC